MKCFLNMWKVFQFSKTICFQIGGKQYQELNQQKQSTKKNQQINNKTIKNNKSKKLKILD